MLRSWKEVRTLKASRETSRRIHIWLARAHFRPYFSLSLEDTGNPGIHEAWLTLREKAKPTAVLLKGEWLLMPPDCVLGIPLARFKSLLSEGILETDFRAVSRKTALEK